MAIRPALCVAGTASIGLVVGCSSPFDSARDLPRAHARTIPTHADPHPSSAFRDPQPSTLALALSPDSTPDEYVRFAQYHNPAVEAAYQKWMAATERLPQVAALPDPRLNFGFFLNEVETRVGPQQARVGVSQTLPWMGKLRDREYAAARAALASWREFEGERLRIAERVVSSLHELAYLDAAIRVARENLDLVASFEQVVRARYRVGEGSHPELVRVQVELGTLQDRLARLESLRPAFVADLNAALNRSPDAEIAPVAALPEWVVSVDSLALCDLALRSNPTLLAFEERAEEQRILGEAARKDGLPDLTVGLEYIVTDDAMDSSIPESGDDPVLLTFSVNVPVWREKYDAGVRETIARRLAISHQRGDQANRIQAEIRRAWFEHTDADRRVSLYEHTLIPKAEESLRASLAGFRAGEASFLDLLDTERTLLEFAVASERARADRGKALARLNMLVGAPVPTRPAGQASARSSNSRQEDDS